MLAKGQTSVAIQNLQHNLNVLEIVTPKLREDGEFGGLTEAAVIIFQTKYKITVDGRVGPQTQAMIAKQLIAHATKPAEPVPVPVEGAAKYWKSPLMIDGVNVHPIFKVPAPYTHLHPYDFLMQFKGIHEVAGTKDNPIIAHSHEHSKNLGLHSDKNDYHDEVANCASMQNWAADGCGCANSGSALASSFDSYPGRKYKKGDLVKRGAYVRLAHPGGHITMANKDFIWDDKGSFEGFGANQGNTLKVSSYAKSTIKTVHDVLALPGTVLCPIGSKPEAATGSEGESTR